MRTKVHVEYRYKGHIEMSWWILDLSNKKSRRINAKLIIVEYVNL